MLSKKQHNFENITNLGLDIGIAFQIRDDIINMKKLTHQNLQTMTLKKEFLMLRLYWGTSLITITAVLKKRRFC